MTDTDEARRKRSEAARKAAATRGTEERGEAALKAAATKGPERRGGRLEGRGDQGPRERPRRPR